MRALLLFLLVLIRTGGGLKVAGMQLPILSTRSADPRRSRPS